MSFVTRLKRATKEILGLKQWPRREVLQPASYEEQMYESLVRPGDNCFDVGANAGGVALFLAKLVGETGQVTAFEPVWPTYCELCGTLQFDTSLKAPVTTVPCGLADAEKRTVIHIPDGQFAMGSMADATAWAQSQQGATLRSYEIQLTTLDSFLASTATPAPDFIKIDVEGAELFVLRGAAGFFNAGNRPLMLIEIFAPWERAFDYQPWEPLSWLLARDYRFLFACPTGLIDYLPTEEKPFPPEYEHGYNVIAYQPQLHAERIAKLRPFRDTPAKLLPMAPPPQPNR